MAQKIRDSLSFPFYYIYERAFVYLLCASSSTVHLPLCPGLNLQHNIIMIIDTWVASSSSVAATDELDANKEDTR